MGKFLFILILAVALALDQRDHPYTYDLTHLVCEIFKS